MCMHFSYELSDLYHGIGYRLNCPEYGEYYYHPSQHNISEPESIDAIPTINLNFNENK